MRDKHKGWYRHIRTTAERRANCDPEIRKYVRGKRSIRMIPNSWDDRPTTVTKSWKDKRHTQYRLDGRGEKREIYFNTKARWGLVWHLEEYFKDNDIPYCLNRLYETEVSVKTGYWDNFATIGYEEYTYIRKIRPYNPKSKKKFKTKYEIVIDIRPIFGRVWVEYDDPHEVYYRHDKGYNLTWWSNKDIGIDYILAQSGCESY